MQKKYVQYWKSGQGNETKLRLGEDILRGYVNQFGSMIVHGDLLSIAMADAAKRVR